MNSIVFEVIRTISNHFFFFFFCEKTLSAQKRKRNQNQLTKQKQGNKKQQRKTAFCAQKLLRGGKLGVSLHSKCFGKKVISCLETVPITSNTLLLKCNPGAFFLLDKNSFFLVIYREYYGSERAFFTLRHFLPYTFSCCFQGFPWSRQFNLKVSRTSCWSSKHSPGTTICLNQSNLQQKYAGRFYLRVMVVYLIKNLLLTGSELFSR